MPRPDVLWIWMWPSRKRLVRKFQATQAFWKSFYALPSDQKLSSRKAWEIFKADPFDPRLRTHKIHSLSGRAGRPVYSCTIEGNLRAIFWVEGDTVLTLDIGTHAIYR